MQVLGCEVSGEVRRQPSCLGLIVLCEIIPPCPHAVPSVGHASGFMMVASPAVLWLLYWGSGGSCGGAVMKNDL